MKSEKSRTTQDIFQDMHRELRSWNPEIPESPDRLDPVLRIMLQLYAGQLSSIDKKIKRTWTTASNALIKSLCPESMRWPIPAFTVMRAEPTDPIVEVDPQTRFFYKEERDNGQTFFFSSLRKERLIRAKLKQLYFIADNNVLDLSPIPLDSSQVSSRMQSSSVSGKEAEIYVAIEYDGHANDFENSVLYLNGKPDALKQLRWARWYPGIDGAFYDKGWFCPGTGDSLNEMFSHDGISFDWGGLRRSSDLFTDLEDKFITLSGNFVTAWRPGLPDARFTKKLEAASISLPPNSEKLFWIRIVLPSGGDKTVFQSAFELYFNCFIAVNKNELTLFKHTGGNRLIDIEIPENIDNVLEIISVIDSNGNNYLPQHEALDSNEDKFYSLIENKNKLGLWFDFSTGLSLPPDSITVNYSITSGILANGISAGKVSELYENHPGILSVENIRPVSGAIPAKTEEQIITEVSARLRGRDRALSFEQIVNWAMTYDSRIKSVSCTKGVMRTETGVVKCIVVNIVVGEHDFYSDDEIGLLQNRLGSFLKSRASVNTRFSIEINKK